MQKPKHRHRWRLEYSCLMPGVCGLLWHCDCGNCLEFSKKPDYKKAIEVLSEVIIKLWKN